MIYFLSSHLVLLLICIYLVNKLCKFKKLKKTINIYFEEIIILKKYFKSTQKITLDDLQENLNKISLNGILLFYLICKISIPYIICLIFLIILNKSISFLTLLLLAMTPYLSLLIRRK